MKLSPGLRKALGDRSRQMTRSGAFSVEDARASLEASLRALGCEHIDIYLLHEASAADCTAELLGFLNEAASAGTIGRFGAGSEFPKVLEIAREHPEFSGVLQFENSVILPNLNQLKKSVTTSSFTITHGAFGRSFSLIREHLSRYPDVLSFGRMRSKPTAATPQSLQL